MAVQAQMRSEGKTVTLSQIAKWFGIPRRTLYYRPRKRIRRVSSELESHVKKAMEKFSYIWKQAYCGAAMRLAAWI